MCPSTNFQGEGVNKPYFRPWEKPSRVAPEEHFSPGCRSSPSNLTCNMCASVFKRESELKRHKSSKHSEKREKCKFCLKEFTRKDNLTRHVKLAHSSENKPQCKFCFKALSRKDAVQRHESTCIKNSKKPGNSHDSIRHSIRSLPFQLPAKMRRKME